MFDGVGASKAFTAASCRKTYGATFNVNCHFYCPPGMALNLLSKNNTVSLINLTYILRIRLYLPDIISEIIATSLHS